MATKLCPLVEDVFSVSVLGLRVRLRELANKLLHSDPGKRFKACLSALWNVISVAESEPPGAATFRAAPEPGPIFLLVGAGSRSRIL